jgi:polysaccharide biosynthesis protein PslH
MQPSKQTKLRMLFVSPEFPYPAYSGGCLRTLTVLGCLKTLFAIHCVTFVQGTPDSQHLETLRSMVDEVTLLPLRPRRLTPLRRYARNAWRALRFVPPLVDRFSEPETRRVLSALISHRPDWVWLEHLWLAPYVASIAPRAVKVLDVHNVESDLYRQMRSGSQNLLDRLGYYVFEVAARRVERQYSSSFDYVLAVSERDRQLLARHCPAGKIFIAPNAVPVPPLPVEEESPGHTLYFAGRLDYSPNRDAVLWFYERVWPAVRSRLPQSKWCIVGASPGVLQPQMGQDSRIVLAGQVENTEGYLRSSSLSIVPVRYGGGTRFKVLEAWAAGKAVISTAKGAEGLSTRHGENIWIAENPEEFINGVIRLLSDRDLRVSLGRKGWETLREHYSLERLCESIEALLRRRPGCS